MVSLPALFWPLNGWKPLKLADAARWELLFFLSRLFFYLFYRIFCLTRRARGAINQSIAAQHGFLNCCFLWVSYASLLLFLFVIEYSEIMSDNQSWNSSGSEEDIESREDYGHPVGVVEFSGVLSKVSRVFLTNRTLPSPFSFITNWEYHYCQSPGRRVLTSVGKLSNLEQRWQIIARLFLGRVNSELQQQQWDW